MKPTLHLIILLLLCLIHTSLLNAQQTVTIDNTSGNLSYNLAGKEVKSIVSLTITGTMDASDFTYMRDSMPSLATIDMSSAGITYYKGNDGPLNGTYGNTEYMADQIPPFAFCNTKTYEGKTTLVSVKLPKVDAVLYNAFWGCANLQTIDLPSSITTLADGAFRNCKSLVNMAIPPYLKSLERYVFSGCTSLTSVTLPATLSSIKDNVFADCTGLKAVHISSLTPQDFINAMEYFGTPENMFANIDKGHCILYVPFGTRSLYAAAGGWKEFTNIVEDSKGFILSADSLQFSSSGGSDNSIRIRANTPWKAVSDQSWLRVSPSSGSYNAILTITAEANRQPQSRQGTLIFTSEGYERKITITQQAEQGVVHVTPGSLSALLTAAQKSSITSLTLAGKIDARDFKTMRDEMPQLIRIDLRQATIVEYTGEGGTLPYGYGLNTHYGDNMIPYFAFAHTAPYTNNTLQSVLLPVNTITVGSSAFEGCTALSSFNGPNSLVFINDRAFYGCIALKTVVLPPWVTVIAREAFANCSSLTDIVIPRSVTVIYENVFQNCTSLASVQFPAGLTTIEKHAFEGCTALASVSLPATLQSIGEYAFADCSSMTNTLIIPSGIQRIEDHTFYRCSKLTAVRFTASLDSIKASAFDGCFALSGDLTLPSTLQFIGERAFANCRSLNGTLTLPSHLATVESFAFVDNRSLSAIIAENPYPAPLGSSYGVFEGTDLSIPVQVPFGSKALYEQSPVWQDFTNIMEEDQGMLLSATSVTFEPEGGSNSAISLKANVAWTAASDQPWLTVSPASGASNEVLTLTAQANHGPATRTGTITLSAPGQESQSIRVTQNSLPFELHTTSGNFRSLLTDYEYNRITRLVITGTMSPPDIMALRQMPLLSEVDMSGVTITPYHTIIARYDFYYLANSFPGYTGGYMMDYSMGNDLSLTSIILPSNLDRIEANAFRGCTNLKTIVFPATLTYIGDNAFQHCTSLTSLQLPPSPIVFGYGSFSGCTSLRTVELSEGITALPQTFEGCSSLISVKLPSTLKSIGYNTFKGCTRLSHLDIPHSVEIIGNGSFNGCTSLTSITLPSSVTSIASDAFAGCTTMSLVILPRSLTTIQDGAFRECRDITSIYCYALRPPRPDTYSQGIFFGNVDFNRCILYVPYGSKQLYEQAVQWKEFKNIREMDEFRLPATVLSMEAEQGSITVAVTSATRWTATSEQSWLTITPSSGTGSTTVTLTAEANAMVAPREAVVNFNVNELQLQDLKVIQKGVLATVNLTPGSLSTSFTTADLMGITRLAITGAMDARDFKTIKDQMPLLTELDLKGATIEAYTGFEGTVTSDMYEPKGMLASGYIYPANGMPKQAFFNGKNKLLSTIVLPPSLTSIGDYAFSGLAYLDSIAIPSSVTSIGSYAFSGCNRLPSLMLPPAIIYLPEYLISDSLLTTVSIPSTVTSIGYMAFGNCRNITTVRSYAPYPPETEVPYYYKPEIFGIPKANITLYVPYGSRKYYAAASNEWKGFVKVVEMPGFRLSAVTLAVKAAQGSTVRMGIASDVQWTATSDQSWLAVSPSSGTGSDSITFTAQANTMDAGRMATITISAPGVVSQTIMVIQEGKPITLDLIPGLLADVLSDEQKSGITSLTITGGLNARDFRTMRDQMPLLTSLDLSQATIAELTEYDFSTGKLFTNRANMIPDKAFFDQATWKGKRSLTRVVFPQTLEKIGLRAFSHATGLTELRFPFTMKYIEYNAFNSCPYVTSIFSHALAPPPSHYWAPSFYFYNIDKTNCILHVPFGSKVLYAAADGWKEFKNIVEMAEFKIMTTKAILEAARDSVRMRIQSQVAWIAEPSEQWLTVNPASGNDNQVITITAKANTTDMVRTGIIYFKAEGYLPQIFTISQKGLNKRINLTAGTLAPTLSYNELNAIDSLTITGTMDARDFRVIRDYMPWLSYLDISGATITAYSGEAGTLNGDNIYKANAIPPHTIFYYLSNNYKSQLHTMLLPANLISFDAESFNGASELTSLIIPSYVSTIGKAAISWCTALDTILIPEGVDSIYAFAFALAEKLSSITIPSSIKYIGDQTFSNDRKLRSIYSYAPVPLELSDTTKVFWQVYTDSCILYVPYGSKALYAAANQWKDFTHIVEMDESQSPVWNANVLTTGVEERKENTAFKCYPNPFTNQIVIEAENPLLKEVTVEIYTINGQKIKTLAKALKGQKISLVWDGSHENGQQMPAGMYLLKVDGQMRKVVKD